MLYRAHASSAKSLLPWVCGTFMWAERKGLLADGYAKVHRLQMLVKEARWRQQGPLRHQPALPVTDLPEFMAELREVGGTTARCLEVAILTVSRVSADRQHAVGSHRFRKRHLEMSESGHEGAKQRRPRGLPLKAGNADPGVHASISVR